MKYACNRKTFLVISLLLSIFASCKKENLAKNLNGTYTGTATQRSLPDMSTIVNFNNCKIVITELDRKKIRLTITRDPTDPASQFFVESMVQDASHFSDTKGGRRIALSIYEGSLQSQQLTFKIETTGSSGPEYEFKFQGTRN